jgi:hypothetical protein
MEHGRYELLLTWAHVQTLLTGNPSNPRNLLEFSFLKELVRRFCKEP